MYWTVHCVPACMEMRINFKFSDSVCKNEFFSTPAGNFWLWIWSIRQCYKELKRNLFAAFIYQSYCAKLILLFIKLLQRTPYTHKLRSSKKDASNSVDESSHRLPPFWDFRLSPYSKKKPTGIQALSPTSKINFKIELKQPSTPTNKLNKQIGNSPRHHSLRKYF